MINNNDDKDIKWMIDKEHRVIVCTLTNCEKIACERIWKYCKRYPLEFDKYYLRKEYVGVARCAPDDEWDEEYGKALALKRAKRKRGVAVNLAVIRYYKRTKGQLDDLLKYGVHGEVE